MITIDAGASYENTFRIGVYSTTIKKIDSTMKSYAMILDDEKKKMVVPSKWLDVHSKILHYPPDGLSVKKLILSLSDPANNWRKMGFVKVIKYFDDYTTAISELKIPDIENLSSPSNNEKLKKSRAKRHQKKYSGASDDEDRPSKKKSRRQEEMENDSDYSISSSPEIRNDGEFDIVMTSNNNINIFRTEYDTDIVDPLENCIEIPNVSTNTPKHTQNKQNDNLENQNNVTDSLNSQEVLLKILGTQEKILKQIHSILLKQDKLAEKIKKINQDRSSNNLMNLSQDQFSFVAEYFPIDSKPENTKKKILVVEEKLKNQKFLKSLVINSILRMYEKIRYMVSIGGSDPNDTIHKIIACLINDEVLAEYSFFGRKKSDTGNKNKSFSELSLCQCIYHAVKTTYKNVTDEDIKASISSWLDSAKTRIKRDQSKTNRRKFFMPLQIYLDDEDNDEDD